MQFVFLTIQQPPQTLQYQRLDFNVGKMCEGITCEIVGKLQHKSRRQHSEAATGKPGHGLVETVERIR